ncbi:TPA: hypothetical protein N0F65_001681 [Lagenidium giganteum]|uniref:Uncharacterized protein n=1 Tax=Lagenidium giganteum TaxID=4803 RepID=A0AAV2YYN4_9STRA|nr:TPA: hypothetical protein N0F65_001681 [Lagenidium giganteum]
MVMTFPQPMHVPVLPPRLRSWNQASLITWFKERHRYEEQMRARCRVTGEAYASVAAPVKDSMDPARCSTWLALFRRSQASRSPMQELCAMQ